MRALLFFWFVLLIPIPAAAQDEGAYLERHPEYLERFPSVDQVVEDTAGLPEGKRKTARSATFEVLRQTVRDMSSHSPQYSDTEHGRLAENYADELSGEEFARYLRGQRVACGDLTSQQMEAVRNYIPAYEEECRHSDDYYAAVFRGEIFQSVGTFFALGLLGVLLALLITRYPKAVVAVALFPFRVIWAFVSQPSQGPMARESNCAFCNGSGRQGGRSIIDRRIGTPLRYQCPFCGGTGKRRS